MSYTSQSEIKEGDFTRTIEEQTGKVPSIGYLGFAIGSMAVSATLAFVLRKRDLANFVGLWAPSILIMGLYNKLVKLEHEGAIVRPSHLQ
jgi:hypothetical protein